MAAEKIELGIKAHLIIHCQGDLDVRSWAESSVMVSGESYTSIESEDGITIHGDKDLRIMAPALTNITVAQVKGDLAMKNCDGPVKLLEVGADAVLRNLASLEITAIRGDCSIRNVSGPLKVGLVAGDAAFRNIQSLEVEEIQGDLIARYVNGSVTLGRAMADVGLNTVNGDITIELGLRDVNLRNLGGILSVKDARGDIRLRGGLFAGEHNVTAAGDIVIVWPAGEPLNLNASAPKINNRLLFDNLSESEGHLSGQMGGGKTNLNAVAGGRIFIKDTQPLSDPWADGAEKDFEFDFNLSDLGGQIANEIQSHFADWSAQLESKLGPEFATKIEKRAQDAAARAERAAEKAVKKAEKAAKKARWSQGQGPSWTAPAPKQEPPESSGPSKEEQLKILKMVEKGIISPEEASSLLEAIGG